MDDILFNLFTLTFLFILLIFLVYFRSEAKHRERILEMEQRLSKAGIYDIDQMKGIEFEQYLAVLFKRLGYRVKSTPGSNDYGADLILENGAERLVIQAKRYKNKVGIKAVQEINSAKAYYNAQEGWVITNNYFTSSAINLAQSANIKLINRNELVDLILRVNGTTSEENVVSN
ncbi:restriction endonuclease [Metabacillus halosaccharovorans]|uniref:restriction endonuclease n=1 Tax=Metabacillus halosaccharovorans TaxID=930124 RepID=UPI0034CF2D4A